MVATHVGTKVIVAEVAMDAAVMVRAIVDVFSDTGSRRVPRLGGVMRQAFWSLIRVSQTDLPALFTVVLDSHRGWCPLKSPPSK